MIRPVDLNDEDGWAMFQASAEGDLGKVESLVAQRAALVRITYNYTEPLHFAVREGHLDVTRFLLEQGAELTYQTHPFRDSLLIMAQDRDYGDLAEFLQELLARQFPLKAGVAGFLEAARRGDLARIRAELALDPGLALASDDQGDTALHQAASRGQIAAIETLLGAGAKVDAVRADGKRPIHCALRCGNPRLGLVTAGVLLARGAAYNIYLAAVFGDMKFVSESLASDAGLSNFEDTCHARPISAAAWRGDLEMVKLLLEHGTNPSLPEEGAPHGQALWTAVYQGQVEMAKLLLEHGANPNTSPESSGSALSHTRKSPELSKMLTEFGARDEVSKLRELETFISDDAPAEVEAMLQVSPELCRDPMAFWGEGILAVPANNRNAAMIELLIRYGAQAPDMSKWGPEYYFKHTEIGELLLKNGMNPNHMDWQRFTLLHSMAARGDVPKARLLLEHGADIDAIDEEYRSTPLGCAVRWGRPETVALLLDRGADPNRAGAAWATPLAWAKKKDRAEIEQQLRAAGAQ